MSWTRCLTLIFFVTSRSLPEVKCGPYLQQKHPLPAEEVNEGPEEDIEALIRSRQAKYGHHSTELSNIPSKGGGGSQVNNENASKSRSRVSPQHPLKSESDFSFDAWSSKNEDEIPIDVARELVRDGHPSPPRLHPALLLQKPSVRAAEIFSVKVQPPESLNDNYQSDEIEEEEEEKANKPDDDKEEKPLQQNSHADDVSKEDHVEQDDVIDSDAPILPAALRQDDVIMREHNRAEATASLADVYLLAVMAGCAVAAVSGLALAGVCWYRLHKKVKAASDVEYPAYGVTGPAKDHNGSPGDRKLAQSAQMYHYQHQKQQMIASERLGNDVNGGGGGTGEGGSEGESEEECEEGDYTVFECPGLATAGEMEVRNPLFNEQTPVATPADK